MTPAEKQKILEAMSDDALLEREQEESHKVVNGSIEWDNSFAYEILRRLAAFRQLRDAQPRTWSAGEWKDAPKGRFEIQWSSSKRFSPGTWEWDSVDIYFSRGMIVRAFGPHPQLPDPVAPVTDGGGG